MYNILSKPWIIIEISSHTKLMKVMDLFIPHNNAFYRLPVQPEARAQELKKKKFI